MNPKIFVGAAIAAVVAGIILVMTSGSSLIDGGVIPGQPQSFQVSPVDVRVDGVHVQSLDPDGAVLEMAITITNPNPNSAILSMVKYQIFAGEERVAAGQIGDRAEGMVGASNYYTVLSGGSVTLKDTIRLTNAGGAPQFWAALESGDIVWRVSGEAFFNLSSMTAGQENEVLFEQTLS